MRLRIFIAFVSATCLLPVSALIGENVSDPVLRQVVNAMSRQMTSHAVSATCVRTVYEPQKEETYRLNNEVAVTRTTVSDIVMNSRGAREALRNATEVEDKSIRHAFYYANDGQRSQVYSRVSKRLLVRDSVDDDANYLEVLTCPITKINRNRFISKSVSSAARKFDGARITSSEEVITGGRDVIVLEGEYADSDPERSFSMTVLPGFNFAVAEMTEYDDRGQVLTEARAKHFIGVSDDLWIARETYLTTYVRDDSAGTTVHCVKLEVIDPKLVPVDGSTFSFSVPENAGVTQLDTLTESESFEGEMAELMRDASEDFLANIIVSNQEGGEAVVGANRTVRGNGGSETSSASFFEGRSMELPKRKRLLRYCAMGGGVIGFAAVIALVIANRGKRTSGLGVRAREEKVGKA